MEAIPQKQEEETRNQKKHKVKSQMPPVAHPKEPQKDYPQTPPTSQATDSPAPQNNHPCGVPTHPLVQVIERDRERERER